jgi:ABC-type multidrug transport system ATPase subunit
LPHWYGCLVDSESEDKPVTARKPPARKPASAAKPRTPAVAKSQTAASAKTTPSATAAKSRATAAKSSQTASAQSASSTEANPAATDPVEPEATATDSAATNSTAASSTAARKPSSAAPRTRPAAKPRTTTARAKKPAVAAPVKTAPAKTPPVKTAPVEIVLQLSGLTKQFGETHAVDHISLSVPAGSIFGIVGPNGAGKTTTLSMVTGLLRPDSGTITVHGADVWSDPAKAKRNMGVLPDRLRLFDRLTGSQLLFYAGTLRGLDAKTVKKRSADLAAAFGLEDALNRLVTDYSAGMTKKIALACAMIHSPRVLILDEPFESVDPVSSANVTEILQNYVAAGGTVVLSSHSMDLIQRICDYVAIVVAGQVLASGTTDEVRGAGSLEARFVELAGGRKTAEGMEWLHSFSD